MNGNSAFLLKKEFLCMDIQFKKVSDFDRGILLDLLTDAYSFDCRYEQNCNSDWQAFDDFFFDNLHIADKYGFVTMLNDEAIGFISWDLRNMPAYAEIGHNCIATKHKGNGYGKAQLREAVNRIIQNKVEKIIVTTNSDLIPAQRMYEHIGFTMCPQRKEQDSMVFEHIYYEYMCDQLF